MSSNTSTERMRLKRQRDQEDPERALKTLDSIYMFEDVDVSVIIDDDENIWFRGVDIARALEMEDPNNAISRTIDKKYCQSYEDLTLTLSQYRNIPRIHPKTTFVNEIGMNMFIMRSRKPRAEAFTEWVCGVVLPSIRKTNKYEGSSSENPYRDLNEYLKKQVEDLNIKNTELINDVRKYTQQLFEIKPSCVPTLEKEIKQEYFVLYRKHGNSCSTPDPMPYYACRVQLDSLEQRFKDLLFDYPYLEKLLQLSVPNSVTFFNYILEKMSEFIERGGKGQSFRIINITENEMLTMIENLYRTLHGGVTTNTLNFVKEK